MPVVKTTFTLKGINIDDISVRYGFADSGDTEEEIKIPDDVTELPVNPVLNYHDSARRRKTGVITMVDLLGRTIPEQTSVHCFWCRHPFDTVPLGIPVKYIPSEAIKRYKSDAITRLTTEPITESRKRCLRDEYGVNTLFTQDPDTFSFTTLFVDNGYYLTDGMVCSFECMLAFIQNNDHDPLYSRSKMFAKRMIRQRFGQDAQITPAGSWRLLKAYGGNEDITSFREGFSTITYSDLRNPLYEHPLEKSIGWLHNREIRF
jgi:hypothetical protein